VTVLPLALATFVGRLFDEQRYFSDVPCASRVDVEIIENFYSSVQLEKDVLHSGGRADADTGKNSRVR